MTYELIQEMGAVRWSCNEAHPRETERLYEDYRFWTGIDECETFGADFLTGRHPPHHARETGALDAEALHRVSGRIH